MGQEFFSLTCMNTVNDAERSIVCSNLDYIFQHLTQFPVGGKNNKVKRTKSNRKFLLW